MSEFRKRLPYTGVKCDMFVVFIQGYLSGAESAGYTVPESCKGLSDTRIKDIQKDFEKKFGSLVK